MKGYLKTFAFIIASITAVNSNAVIEKNIELEEKLNAVANLLKRSTISKQVLHSNNVAAVQYYRFAKSLYNDSVDAYNHGDFKKSRKLINNSRVALFDAVEFSNLKGAKEKKIRKNNYESLRKSAKSLMDALERISVEKNTMNEFKVLSEIINHKLKDSDELYFEDQYDSAITELGKALKIIKVEISKQRSGDTLTKTLSFANAEEEYLYEIDRNDTHFMLLDMFMSEKDKKDNSSSEFDKVIEKARNTRREAELLAANFQHKEAVSMLEKSTMKIISVIRNTGIFIP